MSKEKSSVWPRIAYACGTFGHDVFYAMLATYFMIFVTSNLFHSDNPTHDAYMIGVVTTIILVLRIAELFIDPSWAISSIRQKPVGAVLSHGSSWAHSSLRLHWRCSSLTLVAWQFPTRLYI